MKKQTAARNRSAKVKNVTVDKSAFDDILGVLIPTPPILQDDLKPKRKTKRRRAKKS